MAKDNPEQERLSYRKILHETALKAPSSSGVYMWKNPQDVVIYVGKAKNLKNRLTSYFSSNKDIKTRLLVSHAKSIEYITTANEYEAFLLENNLIKKYTPRYNINLKDGKSYPVLRITNEDFPKVFRTRRILQERRIPPHFQNQNNFSRWFNLFRALPGFRRTRHFHRSNLQHLSCQALQNFPQKRIAVPVLPHRTVQGSMLF